jgi:hypothetical protein
MPVAVDPSPESNPKRRWRPRIGVRGLMLLVLVVGWVFGWFAKTLREAKEQREAVSPIEQAGGYVTYSWDDMPSWTFRHKHRPLGQTWRPDWLADVFSEDFFGTATGVSLNLALSPTTTADPVLPHVARLPRLKTLDIVAERVSIAGLSHLRALPHLEVLEISVLKVTAADLTPLEHLHQLRGFWLYCPPIRDAELSFLKGFDHLEELALLCPLVTDDALANLKGMSQLSQLKVWDTNITDAGLVHLRELNALETLVLPVGLSARGYDR